MVDLELFRLLRKFQIVDRKYLNSIIWNHNGTRIENESYGLKRASSRAYKKFSNYATNICKLSTQEILNYHMDNPLIGLDN